MELMIIEFNLSLKKFIRLFKWAYWQHGLIYLYIKKHMFTQSALLITCIFVDSGVGGIPVAL